MVEVYANTCCSDNDKIIIDYFGGGYCGTSYSLIISPNPTTYEAVVTIENTTEDGELLKSASIETTFDQDAEWILEVYDNLQSLKLKKQKLKGKSTTIQTASWKEGVYMVRVKYKDEILTGKLVVKK
ncbi:T9SS type A sorting domain-containing protein [Draconibacterium halophilum]|uniref:T9SS type A sorting domain-containing protein n=2 Tax=Draconibacterium TaxID=1471399 RepID=A0A6C0RF85_9BACT|nr:T9SS type A sorting domain-containing protein [Draconibacterium halophilum]QIA09060.1 T9SS type A sorting domain-containing protein [Draconibacterium halophilum]